MLPTSQPLATPAFSCLSEISQFKRMHVSTSIHRLDGSSNTGSRDFGTKGWMLMVPLLQHASATVEQKETSVSVIGAVGHEDSAELWSFIYPVNTLTANSTWKVRPASQKSMPRNIPSPSTSTCNILTWSVSWDGPRPQIHNSFWMHAYL